MTAWTPEYRILVNGTNVTGYSLVGVTITEGRSDINAPTPPSYCNLTLINLENAYFPFTINTGLTVEVKLSNGTYYPIFGGRISDLSNEIQASGSVSTVTQTRIIAVGSLAKLQRALFSGNIAEDLDGGQIDQILGTLFSGAWNTVPTALTWASYDPAVIWTNAETTGLGAIDTGEFTMASRQVTNQYVSDLVNEIAQSAGGYMYEDENGAISYADFNHRQDYFVANGYVELDAGEAFYSGVSSSTRQGDLVNKLTANYGNNNSYTAQDADSISQYGLYAEQTNSLIKGASDVQSFADRVVRLRAYPRERFQSITFPLQNPEMDTATRDALLQIFMGMPIRISNLPNLINLGRFEGFVEGWNWRSTLNGISLTITASPTAFNLVSQKWSDVNIAEAWNTISTTLEWQDVTIIA